MSEKPLFGDQDPALREPTAEQLLALEAAADNYFSGELSLGEQGVSVDLGFGYSIHLQKKGISRLTDGRPENLSEKEARDLYDDKNDDYSKELAEDGRRLYVNIGLPDKSSLYVRSYLDPIKGFTGYGYTGMIFSPASGRTIGEVSDIYSQVEGYDGFEVSQGQLERIADLSTIALSAIKQKAAGNETPAIDIHKVKECVDYLVETSNTYDLPDSAANKGTTIEDIKAFQAALLPTLEKQPINTHFGDTLQAKYNSGLPVAQSRVGYTITVNPDGSILKSVTMNTEESRNMENSLNNTVVTLFEKTADGEALCSSFSTISEDELADKTSPLNWTAMLLGESLESMLEAGAITKEEYADYTLASSLKDAAIRRRRTAEAEFRAEIQAGFHRASFQDVSRVTELIDDMCRLRYPEKHRGLQERFRQLNEQADELVEGALDVARKYERLEFSDGSSIEFEQEVIAQYRNGQAVELTKEELDEIYAAEGRDNRWEERYLNRFFVSFNMPNRIRAYITGRLGDNEAIGCYYEDLDTTGKFLHTRVESKARAYDKDHEDFEAANQTQVDAITEILVMINKLLSERKSPTEKLEFGHPELNAEIWQLLEATATKNGNIKDQPSAPSINDLHDQMKACMTNASLSGAFNAWSAHSVQQQGMSEASAYVTREVEGDPITGYRNEIRLSASEHLNIPALRTLNGADMWSFKLTQSGADIIIEDMQMSTEDLAELLEDTSKLQELESISYEEANRLLRAGELTPDDYRLATSGANWLNAKWMLRQVGMQSGNKRKANLNDLERALEFVRLIREHPSK